MRSLALCLLTLAMLSLSPADSPAAAPWHHPLYLDGGGYWSGRVRVVVRNESDLPADGEPVAIAVGSGPGEAALAGKAAEAVRVVNESGEEMLFDIEGPDGNAVRRGPIPPASRLVLPAECAAKASAAYYVYFDNPSAGEVPDFLAVRLGVVNGDLEQGDGPAPAGWTHDAPDEHHRAAWSEEKPQSGKKCLKTVVDAGAEPTWIATRQQGIHLVGGARYAMRAWVRAENVQGMAGWYIHVGNAQNPMIVSPTLNGGDGTFDWKEVTAEFTCPAEADQADLGTVLRGTGTAWFDRVSLECLQPGRLSAAAERPERMDLAPLGADAPWPDQPGSASPACDRRALVTVLNFSGEEVSQGLVGVELNRLAVRMGGHSGRPAVEVAFCGKPVPHELCGDLLVFPAAVPARTVQTYCVYPSAPAPSPAQPAAGQPGLLSGRVNLAANPGFEQGQDAPDSWTHTPAGNSADGVFYGFGEPGDAKTGQRCVKMHVPKAAPESWRGWTQSVPVRPARTYLVGAWVKCRDIEGGEVRVHVHRHQADGQMSRTEPMTSVGPSIRGTTDWTWMSGLLDMPEDTASITLHLTMNCSGTLWHDDVLVSEICRGQLARVEGRPLPESEAPRLWPVDAVVKVFPEDPAPSSAAEARVSAARNEQEPLQVAIRVGRAIGGARVEVDPPVGPQGARLQDVSVGVVGYVPIDYPTNYYQTQSPAWRRKIPSQNGACDGWPGLWPDPLLPRNTLDLAPNSTQAVWLTLAVGKDAPAGDYAGKLRLMGEGRTLAEMPFTVHVWDFSLPDESHVAAIYDARLGPGGAQFGKSLDAVYPEIVRLMARNRLCPDAVRPGPVFRCENGQVSADFTEFDKAGEFYFNQLKLPHAYTPGDLYLFGWGHPPKTMFGERPYPGEPPYEGADRGELRPEYKKVYQQCLKLFWDHVKEKGWEKKFVLYISDEPFDWQPHIRRQMQALCDMIHEVDPHIPIYSSTWKHVPAWDGYLNVWGVGHYGIVPAEKMSQLQAAGDTVWFTTDGQMCTDTPYCAVERLLPHYCFHYGARAYEFWGVAWTTYDPYRYGWHAYIHQSDQPGKSYWVRYPNGDGFLLYPGPPIGQEGLVRSIRFEQAREGVEDYEYLYLLRARIAEAKLAGRDTAAAELALKQAGELVTIPNAGGRWSTKILPDPARVFAVKRAVAEAIEQLGR